MGRRQGTVDSRVPVAVSGSMLQLRRMQGVLNGFWQTSELAYGFFLSQSSTFANDPDRPTVEVLGHIESQVWFPNNQGRIKREDKIGTTLKQIQENTIHAYRATLLSFYSSFEAYLDAEASGVRRPGNSWGPFVWSLSDNALRSAKCPLPLRVVLCADYCRLVRNKMTHQNLSVPIKLCDPEVISWKNKLAAQACKSGWPENEVSAAVDYAAHQVIGQAVNHVEEAKVHGKFLPIELFYMLFNFTNLDSLAFSIEEALQSEGSRTDSYVWRKESAVTRHDLVIDQSGLPPLE
jgi:hypothetical protein